MVDLPKSATCALVHCTVNDNAILRDETYLAEYHFIHLGSHGYCTIGWSSLSGATPRYDQKIRIWKISWTARS